MEQDRPKLTLKQLREKAELSQEALARLVGVSSKTVSNWERGTNVASLTVPQMKALCEALGVTLNELPDDFSSERE
ncbi:helix-turn-helix transcriptional regulator [Thermoleptolyngbya sichuanensis A183]|uniref:Helix-turn-helix transcriptional regulator n=2 Tax=Oculatellaceae TaxID=2303507 RepID=A0A6M8BJV2_9CYAN|nr:helix-turn-helix transcriptional regulator [Thermoleptolyngbya sichuanensis]MDG2615789.1 helix-turn-helix transcriptional regulator [Thermoleptolyngbya sichuanensis XZ-Cy5]QKD84806.1 helix-turn-helix transcriptional regulator [Thermoleptolyngbya sichuanensis A183]